MRFIPIQQKSTEWFELRAGKITGTRFGKVISGRENELPYTLVAETVTGEGEIEEEGYVSAEMQYGLDNEEYAIDIYEAETKIKVIRGGVILSDYSEISMASPDGHNADNPKHIIVQEVKCTMKRSVQVKRFLKKSVDSTYKPQCINYFTQSDDIKEVHFISYCGFDKLRPLVVIELKREDFAADIEKGRKAIKATEIELAKNIAEYTPAAMQF